MEAGVRRILLVLFVVVLLLTGFTAEVNVPPIHRAIAGSDTLIPCTFSSVKLPVDPTFLVVSWYFEGKKILSYDANLWTLDFRFILDTVKAINGDASLSVKRVTIPDSGVYRCSIRYKTEQTEKNITFYVHAPPEIEITKKIVVMNEESILSSSITGFYPVSIDIKWFREKTVLENVQLPRPWSNPDGTFSVNSSVTITPTEEDKNQIFSCSVQHESGPLRKDFQLEYGAIPSIEIVSSEFFLNKEQSLICRVFGFNPSSIIVEWFLDGTAIKTTKTRRIDISAVDSVYQFTPTEENWGLELSCRVQHQTLSAPLVRKLLVDGKVLAIRHRIGMFVSLVLILPLCAIIVFYIKAGNNEEKDEVDGIKDPQRASEIFKELLEQLGMKDNISKDFKLTLKDYLIVEENLMEIKQSVPWRYFRKLMSLNRTARDTVGQGCQSNQRDDNNSVHPLDVVCALLHCSHHLLQQEIVSKMSMCQFAVPLLLPAGDGTYCTLMVWAMRDIVKRWRPHSLADSKGFMEDNVVNVSMPTFSFVRLGKTKLSKSKILNQVLSQHQQHLDFFIHNDMQGGNIKRKISNGLVEMSWYFPSGSDSSDIFPEPIAVTNLRGGLESNWNQFIFLSRVSTAVFIFIERIGEREIRILSKCDNSSTKYYFILSASPRRKEEEYEKFKTALSGKGEIIKREETENDSDFQKKIIQVIQSSITRACKRIKIQDMQQQTSEPNLRVDELYKELLTAKDFAGKITKEIKDVIQYKKETMILQGDLWRQISKLEKEMCARRNQTTTDSEEHPSELKRQLLTLREKQFAHHLPPGIQCFIEDFANLSREQKPYYLKCIKSDLDSVSRETRLALRKKHSSQKDPYKKQDQHQLDQKISDSSLGIEHFLREMGQIYESENFISKEKGIKGENAQIISKLPGIAADILLDGFPLELIDGDASNIPMQWITDILQEVDTKTGGRCRMRVITVLGVQGTGKSTLLNTMFGLQFPVASGRCTRGAFMTLIRVGSNLKKKMGCDFILVIDTEGLRAPELASLEGSYEHDKELATLVVRLSDITIVNMDMKNTIGGEGILKIVIHSLLIMKKGNKKLNCQFVHQKVPDPSTQEELMRDKNTFQEMLDKMTADTATVAGKPGISRFSDLVEFSIDEDHWYVPNMLIGVSPMASISIDYSERIFKLKKRLFNIIKQHKPINAPLGIKEFISWIDSLCEAVKRENPVYSSTPSGGPKYGT